MMSSPSLDQPGAATACVRCRPGHDHPLTWQVFEDGLQAGRLNAAYNLAKHLRPLRWQTPFQSIREAWQKKQSVFKLNPHYLIPGPNT